MLKKILLASIFVITAITNVTHAEDDMKTVASKAYVDTQIETKQLKIPAAGQPNVGAGETVMTYTATGNGQIGERGLYSDISSYNATTDGDKLITASALNATFTNLPTTPTTKLECANQADGCTLWTIVDQTAYGDMLPSGYTRLEYIQSTGTQYIDTGVTGGVTIRAVAQQTTYTGSSQILFGTLSSGVAGSYFGTGTTSEKWGFGAAVSTGLSSIPANTKATLEITYNANGGATGTVNGETISRSGTQPPQRLTIFSAPTGTYKGRYKLWSCEVYQNDVLVRDFVPAKNSSNVIGMYDTVSGQFFTNSGTGDFAGPAAN